MSHAPSLEERVSRIERDLASLKSWLDCVPDEHRSAPGVDPDKSRNPWLEGAGMFRDDPLFDAWQHAIAEYRREADSHRDTP